MAPTATIPLVYSSRVAPASSQPSVLQPDHSAFDFDLEMAEGAGGRKRASAADQAAAAAAAFAAAAASSTGGEGTEIKTGKGGPGQKRGRAGVAVGMSEEEEVEEGENEEGEEEEEQQQQQQRQPNDGSAEEEEIFSVQDSPQSGPRRGAAAALAGLQGAGSGEEGEQDPPAPAPPTFAAVAALTGPTTAADKARLPRLSPTPPLPQYPVSEEHTSAPRKRFRVTVRHLLQKVKWSKERLLSEVGALAGNAGGVALNLILSRGLVFEQAYRYPSVLWELARRACSKGTFPAWNKLPGDSAFPDQLVRQWRTANLYNFLASAFAANASGFRLRIVDAFKNMRKAALRSVASTLDDLHSNGVYSLHPIFYKQCLSPLEMPGAAAAAAAAVGALEDEASEAECKDAATKADTAFWDALDLNPPIQRLLSKQGTGKDTWEGLLNAVLQKVPRGSPPCTFNPLCALTGVVLGLTGGGRAALLEEETFGRGEYLALLRKQHDPLDLPVDQPPCAPMYYFTLLAVAHFLRQRSRVRGDGVPKPHFASDAFPAQVRLWDAVHKWHRRLPTDMAAMGIEPRGSVSMASWGFVRIPAAQREATVTANAINPTSPPAKRRKRGKGAGGGAGGGGKAGDEED